MPELPEAETIARGLHARLAGRRIEQVRIHRSEVVKPMTPTAFRRALQDRRVKKVGRRAKWITALLDNGHRWVTQLRMTGRYTWTPNSRLRRAPHLSASIQIAGVDGGVLRFFDTRRFGRLWVLDPDAWRGLDRRLGVEPLSRRFTPDALAASLGESQAPVRNALLDQRRVAGIGNIYANEACFQARIDPRRAGADLERRELRRLHRAIRDVLGEAVERRGTSFSDYRDVLGETGGFQNRLDVYGRDGEPCRRCGAAIERVVLAGRSAFYCPGCQR